MNERIRELAEQAGFQSYITTHEEDVAMFEKFAELIVGECVRYFNEDYQRDFDTLWREDLSRSIRQHFGVE